MTAQTLNRIWTEQSIKGKFLGASLRHAWREALTYRADVFTKLVGYPFRVVMAYFLWKALFAHGVIEGQSFGLVLTYYLLVFLLTQVFPFARMARNIGDEINQGGINGCLTRGYSHSIPWLSRCIARAAVYGITIGPIAVLVVTFLGKIGASVDVLLPAAICLALGTVLRGQLWYLIGLTAFFLENNIGAVRLYAIFERFMAGAILPIFLFPQWFQKLSAALPFAYTLYQPVELFVRGGSAPNAWGCAVIVAGWCALVGLASKLLFNLGWRRYTSHGL